MSGLSPHDSTVVARRRPSGQHVLYAVLASHLNQEARHRSLEASRVRIQENEVQYHLHALQRGRKELGKRCRCDTRKLRVWHQQRQLQGLRAVPNELKWLEASSSLTRSLDKLVTQLCQYHYSTCSSSQAGFCWASSTKATHQFSYSMPFNKSRPTRPFISGHDAPSVQGKRESSTADADEQQTGRKSLQLLNATHDAAYNVCKGQLEQGTVSCPELTAVAYDGNNNPLTQRSRRTVGRRISRSVPRPDKSRSIKDKCLQLVQQWTQKRNKWNISFFGEPFPMRDGQRRRIQAQDSRGRLDSCETYTHPAHSPLGTEAMGSLARAGMMLATEDLDRLSERARVYQEVVEEQQTEGFRTDKVGNVG